MKVAFQGERGAYSEEAAYHYWNEPVNADPMPKFRDVFNAVKIGQSDYGIIPIENSLTGSVHENIDLLMDFELAIVAEVKLHIRHHLLGFKGARLDQIRTVYSHPQALMQCSQYLEGLGGVEAVSVYDTAGSARLVAEKGEAACASIASHQAGKDYGLDLLAKDIENNHENYTRFVILSSEPDPPSRGGKTSVVFSMKDVAGALYKCLAVFALRDISLLKIESRPLVGRPWHYLFYLDFEGSVKEEHCRKALDHLDEITHFVKVLGSYPEGRVVP